MNISDHEPIITELYFGGVVNPIFRDKKQFCDILCLIDEGEI